MSCGLKSGGLMSGGLKSYDRILVAVISNCVGVAIGSWMMSDLMASSTPPYPSCLSFRRSE